MALAVFKTYSAGEVLTASDLNSSFTTIHNNALSLISPLTGNLAAGGFVLTGLGAGAANGESVRFEQLAAAAPLQICEFRLTLTSATPVTNSDVTSATTVYVSPYKGNRIALYDGSTRWNVRSSAEMSIAVPATTDTMYDLFCYDNSGTPTLEALAWSSDTARATNLTLQDGVLVKSGATTRRYLGSFRTTGVSGRTEDSFAKRYVWNYYNRVRRAMRVLEATNSWTYTNTTIRQANGSTANQLDMVVGWSEDVVTADIFVSVFNTNAQVQVVVGVGLDATNTFTAGNLCYGMTNAANTTLIVTAQWKGYVGHGRHFLSWNEHSAATGTTTWVGDGGLTTTQQSGIHGELWG